MVDGVVLTGLEDSARAKQGIRERIWRRLERAEVARFPGAMGRIPNFIGAEAAADRLAQLPEWRAAAVIKANPDAPQLPVRARALAEGKRVYMAVPRLRERRPFLLLDPNRLSVAPRRAASIVGAGEHGRAVSLPEMEAVDLIVCGSVAVNRRGVRIGKGGGYSDLELALLSEAGKLGARTPLVTTIHPLQLVDQELPETEHDFRVHRIVTPDRVIRTGARRRPRGILWDHLDEEKIGEIPVLRALRA